MPFLIGIINTPSEGRKRRKTIGMAVTQTIPVVVFDLDGTLVDTDEANSLAYKKAIYDITGKHISLDGSRITRDTLQDKLGVNRDTISSIVSRKESIFDYYLDKTKPLPALRLAQYLTSANVVLLTLARRKRAISVLEYYHAKSYFKSLYFKEDYGEKSKFEYLRTRLFNNLTDIILFENEQDMIKEAVEQGIPARNIYQQI